MTITVRGHKVRSQSQRRYVVVRLSRIFDGVRYSTTFEHATVAKRSDSLATARTWVSRQGFHQSRLFVVIDTATGDEV